MSMEVDAPGTLAPAAEDFSHIDDDFVDEYDAPEYSPPYENKEVKLLPSFCKERF